jgi:hypothetical protein
METGITVQYSLPSVTFTPATQNIDPGGAATLTALVDTTNKTVYPTGIVNFVNWQNGNVLAGPLACTNTKDSSGNYACQVSATVTVTAAVTVTAQYLGDTNYPATTAGIAQIVVNDFAIGIDSSSIVTTGQGQSKTAQFDVSGLGAFNGTVGNFTCSGLPPETTCSFNPTQVTGQGVTIVTITTAAPGQSRGQMRRRASSDVQPNLWMGSAMLPLLGACLIGIPLFRRRREAATTLMVVLMIATFMSCGGGGSNPPPVSNPVPSITSLSPNLQAAGSQPTPVMINGSGFMNGSAVTYNGVSHAAGFVNSSQLTLSLATNDLATLGTYPVVVMNPAPGGGRSSPVNFNVVTGTPTGSFTVIVGASSGSLAHTTTFTLTIQ